MYDNQDSAQQAKANIRKQAGLAVMSIIVMLVLAAAMAVAWYSNVIHSENLTFKTASWDFNFDGTIEVTATQEAAPGRTGVVELSLTNEGEDPIDVIVNVSRELFSNEMKKRIYFYVDDTKAVNFIDGANTTTEVMNRVYVNEIDEYTYTILGKNTLTLGEEYANAPLLKWEWVYDVLGYYVQGTVTSTDVDIDEYLRPISYDYEKATFTDNAGDDDETNNDNPDTLLTVDGEKTVAEFLAQLSKTDGYESDINYSGVVNGYYPVSVDANGKGIWVYLCNESEVLAANQIDTILGEQATNGTVDGETTGEFIARLLLTGQPKEMRTSVAASMSDFATYLQDENVDRIQLSGDMQVTEEPLNVPSGRTVTIDLNGYNLIPQASGTVIEAEKGSTLIVTDGSISGINTTDAATAVYSYGAQVTLNNVDMSNVYNAVYIDDSGDDATGADSTVIIEDCTLDTNDVTVMIRGNGTKSARKTTLIINDSKLVSKDYIAIMGNGSAGGNEAWGTNITVNASTLEGKWAAIYHPQRMSTLTITNSTLTGYTALAIKGGTVEVDSSTIIGTGAQAAGAFAVSGFTDTGDAIYVETNYETEISVTVTGASNVRSDYSYAIQVFDPEAEHASVIVKGGNYSTDVSQYLPADGSYTCTQTADELYGYTVGETPASVN